MKKIFITILFNLILLTFIYLICSFVQLDLRFFKWSLDARFALAVYHLIVNGILTVLYHVELDK